MSVETDLNTDDFEMIHVALVDEDVAVWRPVKARRIGGNVYVICDQPVPASEVWQFVPGDAVLSEVRETSQGRYRVAISSAG